MTQGAPASNSNTDLTWEDANLLLGPLIKADNWTNLWHLAFEYTLVILTLTTGALAWFEWRGGNITWMTFCFLAAPLMIQMGALQHRLSGLGHEGSHYSLFRNKWVNELVSDFLLMFPVFALTHGFREFHLRHHQYVNDPGRDPDVRRLENAGEGAFPLSAKQFIGRYILGAFWLPKLWTYLFRQGKNANHALSVSNPLKNLYSLKTARWMRFIFWIVVFATLFYFRLGIVFLIFWAIPLSTFYAFFMQLREIAHHSNTQGSDDFGNSRIFRVNPLLNWLVFPYGQDDHLVHHLFAIMPHYQCKNAHEILMRVPEYRQQAVICSGYFFRSPFASGPSLLELLAVKTPPKKRWVAFLEVLRRACRITNSSGCTQF